MAFFTYLIPADGVYPGKIISFLPDGSSHQTKAAHSSLVKAEKYEFFNFDEMCDALYSMVDRAEGFVVRGEVSPTYVGNGKIFNRKLGKKEEGKPFWRFDPQWLCLDIDGLLKPDYIDPTHNPEEAIKFVIDSLPAYFHGVSCWWQWSSSQSLRGNSEVLKCHLFYMLMAPVPEERLVSWAKSHKVQHKIDDAVMRSNQPVYILPPKIQNGKDWLPIRCGIHRDTVDRLDLNLFAARDIHKESKVIPIDQKKILAKYLINIGDGNDGEGFNEPIKSAIGAVFQKCGPNLNREKLKEQIREIIKDAPENPKRGKPKEEYMSDRYLDPLIDSISNNEKESRDRVYSVYEDARARYVYITNINRFYDKISGNYLTKESLNMALTRVTRNLADIFVGDEDFLIVDQLTYYPGRDEICAEIALETGSSARCLNIYKPPRIDEEPAELAEMFVEHVKKLAGDDNDVFNHMMDWMAFNIQRPGDKIMYAMLIQGKQGTGKSALMEAMKMCLGGHNVRPLETYELLGNFTSWMKGKCLAVVEEIRDSNDKFSVYNRLKPLITGPTITLNEKNIAAITMRNRMNIMAFTNYENAVPMDADDRRFFVHFSPMQAENSSYYDKLFSLIYEHPGAIRQVFMEWNIDHFNPNGRAPMTKSKEKLLSFSGPPLSLMFGEAFKHVQWPLKCDIICPLDLADAIQHRYKVSQFSVMTALNQYNPVEIGNIRVDDMVKRLFVIRNHDKWKNVTKEEMHKAYQQPHYDFMSRKEGYIGDNMNVKGAPDY